VLEAASAAFVDAGLTQGPKAITLPHQLDSVKVLNKSSNDDWLASHGGTEEEKAFYNYWRARGGQRVFDRFTGPAGFCPDSYLDLRRMVTRRAYLAKLSQEWTVHGLDTREAFFWGGPLAGVYLPMAWKQRQDKPAQEWRRR
jgi:hypothetical protein